VNLTDDNDDGAVDERDVPDIVVNTLYPLEDRPDLLALHGDGSGVIFGVYGVDPQSGIAVADIDLDGLPEVVTVLRWFVIAPRAEVVTYGHDGSEEWRSEPFDYDGENDQGIAGGAFGHPYLTVSDVDQDGVPEVVTPWAIFDGMTGATEVVLDEYYDDYINHVSPHVRFFPATADLDHDGFVEILLEDSAYEADGTQIWEDPSYPETTTIISSAVADLSGDAMTTTRILAADGTLVSTLPEMSPESHIESCLPAIADFDGDGEMEIAIAGKYDVVVTEVNGTPVWTSHDRFDPSGAAGCSAFDFDVDGAYELLCGDELDFRIHDGRTGAVLYLWADHASATGYEYPVVADVDGDGSAEIVLACNEQLNPEAPCKGIAVLGHADNAWPPAGPVWSVHDYTPMRIRPDGRVESELIAPWSIHNMFLARPPGDGLADLMPIEGETCLASCEDGPWEINWAVANQGLLNQREPISVALYAVEGETEILIAVHQVDEVEYGYQAPGERFELTPDQWGDGIRIVVDDDGTGVGTVDECDEGNNVLEIAAPACP
jgi:hypothetical protein